MKKRTKSISLGEIAQHSGFSASTVSRSLQNKPSISPATRARIHSIAQKLGYAPDASLSQMMTRLRDAKSKELLPIAWLNTSSEKDAWQRFRFHTPYMEGASARALELGYKIEEVWLHEPGMTMQRMSKILYQRGMEGIVVTHPARHLRFNWDHLASVTLGTSLMVPRLHRIIPDLNFNLMLALKSLKRFGYRRIGICLSQEVETGSQYTVRATAHAFYSSVPQVERVPPLFHPSSWMDEGKDEEKIRSTVAWVKRHKPEVIVCHDNRLEEWTNRAGLRVPEDVGLVHLAVDDDVLDWGGIHSGRREMGATAIDWLVSLIRNHQFGVPKTPLNISIRGSWQTGRTLQRSLR